MSGRKKGREIGVQEIERKIEAGERERERKR